MRADISRVIDGFCAFVFNFIFTSSNNSHSVSESFFPAILFSSKSKVFICGFLKEKCCHKFLCVIHSVWFICAILWRHGQCRIKLEYNTRKEVIITKRWQTAELREKNQHTEQIIFAFTTNVLRNCRQIFLGSHRKIIIILNTQSKSNEFLLVIRTHLRLRLFSLRMTICDRKSFHESYYGVLNQTLTH